MEAVSGISQDISNGQGYIRYRIVFVSSFDFICILKGPEVHYFSVFFKCNKLGSFVSF